MIIVLATTFYVRSIKSKLDTKVDAMFQLVQSLVNEVNQLKMSQSNVSKPNEVIELDINSSNKQESYSETSDNETSDSETSDSDDDDDDDNDSPHEVNTQNNMSIEPVHVDVEPVHVDVEPVHVDVEPVEIDVEPVEIDVEPVVVDVEPVASNSEELKKVVIESAEQNYESFTVKELKELVSAKGGKITGKKKGELIEFLLS